MNKNTDMLYEIIAGMVIGIIIIGIIQIAFGS